jgi:hypothetical protein
LFAPLASEAYHVNHFRENTKTGENMKQLTIFVLTLMLSLTAFAQKNTADKGSKGGGAEQQIKALEEQGNQAMLKGDAAWGKAHSTANYTFVDPQGAASTAEGNMPEPKFTGLDISEQNIRVFGNAAVVVEKASVKGTVTTPGGDQSIDGDYRVTHVWVKEGGQWKLASGQVTKIAAGGGM